MRDYVIHEAVMVDQVIENLIADKKGNYVDCTFGLGGHASAILKRLDSEAQLTGIDRKDAFSRLKAGKMSVKKAVVMQEKGISLSDAEKLLKKFEGSLRMALE